MVRDPKYDIEEARERMAVLRAANAARTALVLGLPDPATPHVVATSNCRNCGAPPSAGVGACRYCGTPHGVLTPTTPTYPAVSPTKQFFYTRKD